MRAALASRTTGTTYMLSALARRPDFLAGETRTPPAGPLADALAASREKRAAPLLADILLDPATPAADVERAAAALVVLARPSEEAPLRAFFAMYRSESGEPLLVAAVAHVARALTKLGSRDVVTSALSDPYTSEAVRSKLAAPDAGPSAGAARGQAPGGAR